jgi:hypothetical protein
MEHFDHDHEHAHSGAYTHSHPHTHEHSHEHPNSHTHDGAQALAVLQYMLDHNIHHAGELSDIAAQFDGEARHQLLHAVESFDQANGYLSAALELLKGQNKN